MKSHRLTWMRWHTYIACFFLPATLIYLSTGVLHLVGIEGKPTSEHSYEIALPHGWPKDEAAAHALASPVLETHGHRQPKNTFYLTDEYASWYGYKRETTILPTEDTHKGELKIVEHDLMLQLLLIHKGFAGTLFWVFGILFGLHLLFSVISGVVLALQLPKLKRSALAAVAAGFSVFILAVIFGG